MKLSQGAKAVANGQDLEGIVEGYLSLSDYTFLRHCKTIAAMKESTHCLFSPAGCYATQCEVPLISDAHRGRDHIARVDFLVRPDSDVYIPISCKGQQTAGSADEKLEYEIRNLAATQLFSAMLVHGPAKPRDGKEGWKLEMLEVIWERVRYELRDGILLFRSAEKLSAWIKAGMPIPGYKGMRGADIMAMYGDREP